MDVSFKFPRQFLTRICIIYPTLLTFLALFRGYDPPPPIPLFVIASWILCFLMIQI